MDKFWEQTTMTATMPTPTHAYSHDIRELECLSPQNLKGKVVTLLKMCVLRSIQVSQETHTRIDEPLSNSGRWGIIFVHQSLIVEDQKAWRSNHVLTDSKLRRHGDT